MDFDNRKDVQKTIFDDIIDLKDDSDYESRRWYSDKLLSYNRNVKFI